MIQEISLMDVPEEVRPGRKHKREREFARKCVEDFFQGGYAVAEVKHIPVALNTTSVYAAFRRCLLGTDVLALRYGGRICLCRRDIEES